MPVAAVPAYLRKADFSQATPSQRFSSLLAIWTDRADQEVAVKELSGKRSREGSEVKYILERQGMDAAIAHALASRGNRISRLWEKSESGASKAWDAMTELGIKDIDRMHAWHARQTALAGLADAVTFDAISTAPFATGLGNEHPLENGFAFLEPYGLPYLPGSGVKGVLRAAATELAEGLFGGSDGWTAAAIEALFGRESMDGDQDHQRGALSFWDVLPQLPGNRLQVEVMTPHQGHYYAPGGTSQPPHDSGSPIPIFFLAVPPEAKFTFHVQCNRPFLDRIAPGLAGGERWKTLLDAAFRHAFEWLGFGAKTSVGYGAMALDERAARERSEAERERQEAERRKAQEAARHAELERMSPVDRKIREAIDDKQSGQSDDSAVFNAIRDGRFTDDERREAAQKLRELMKQSRAWKEKSTAKKPEKDKEHQRTLQVIKWLES